MTEHQDPLGSPYKSRLNVSGMAKEALEGSCIHHADRLNLLQNVEMAIWQAYNIGHTEVWHHNADELQYPLNSIQAEVRNFREQHGDVWKMPHPRDTWLFCVTELSEIGDWMVRNGFALKEGYFRMNPDKLEGYKEIVLEFGDLLVMLATLANQLGVDFDFAARQSMNKIASKVLGFEEDPRV